MTFLKTVLAAPAAKKKPITKKTAPKTMEVFRGVKDVSPTQVDHRYKGEGVFGPGTYYALREHSAEEYATGVIGHRTYSRFALVFGYSITVKNPLELTPAAMDEKEGSMTAEGLLSNQTTFRSKVLSENFGFPSSMPREHLSEEAHDAGFDSIILTSDNSGYNSIDGDEQMLIPNGSSVTPKLLWLDVLLNDDDEELAEEIEELGGNVSNDSNNLKIVNTPISKIKQLAKLLEKASSNPAADEDD